MFASMLANLSQYAMFLADLIAIAILVFGLFIPRHGRRDLVVAFVVVNVGVLAVSSVLATTAVGAGVGLGLFGVLSIIRLRSTELAQHEIAYYFGALALGLLAGLSLAPTVVTAVLMSLIVAAVWFGDHPTITGRGTGRGSEQRTMLLDRAFTREADLREYAESLLGARILDVHVHKVDLVNDTTLVDLRVDLRVDQRGDQRGDVGPDSGVEQPTYAPHTF